MLTFVLPVKGGSWLLKRGVSEEEKDTKRHEENTNIHEEKEETRVCARNITYTQEYSGIISHTRRRDANNALEVRPSPA